MGEKTERKKKRENERDEKNYQNIFMLYNRACFISHWNGTNIKRHPPRVHLMRHMLTWNMNERWTTNQSTKKPRREISTASKRHALITSLSVALRNDIEEKSVSTYSWDLTVLSVSAYVRMCMWKKCTGQKKKKKLRKKIHVNRKISILWSWECWNSHKHQHHSSSVNIIRAANTSP